MSQKDDRKIVSGVVIGDTTYTDVDELAKVITPEQIDYLTERGAITGTWAAKNTAKAGAKAKGEK